MWHPLLHVQKEVGQYPNLWRQSLKAQGKKVFLNLFFLKIFWWIVKPHFPSPGLFFNTAQKGLPRSPVCPLVWVVWSAAHRGLAGERPVPVCRCPPSPPESVPQLSIVWDCEVRPKVWIHTQEEAWGAVWGRPSGSHGFGSSSCLLARPGGFCFSYP